MTDFSRLWRGLEQTAFKFLKRVSQQDCIMRNMRKDHGYPLRWQGERYVTALHNIGQAKSLEG